MKSLKKIFWTGLIAMLMKSLKKVFWTGLIATLVIWVFVSFSKFIYNALAPLRSLIGLLIKHPIPGMEFLLAMALIAILGFVITHIHLPVSKIPIVSKIGGAIKAIKNAAGGLERNEITAVIFKLSDKL